MVAVATWDGVRAVIESDEENVRATLSRVFRASSIVIDDSALRPAGASGETVVEPGDLEWFRAAATVRGAREGLGVRFASDAPGGWDPAGSYHRMPNWVDRLESPG